MNRQQIRDAVLQALGRVAPEADLAQVDPAIPLREQFDIDSMDFLNFVVALHKGLGVDVPERDYSKLATLDGCVAYLATVSGNPRRGCGQPPPDGSSDPRPPVPSELDRPAG
jgi:acyl carrier protein